jgi:hypothetical protein
MTVRFCTLIFFSPKLSDLPEQTGLISDWMPDHVRHDWKPLGLIRHSGEGRNPESSPF